MPIYDTGAIKLQAVFELKELVRYRFLVSHLMATVARDFNVRYKRPVLSFVWVMLNLLLQMAVLVPGHRAHGSHRRRDLAYRRTDRGRRHGAGRIPRRLGVLYTNGG